MMRFESQMAGIHGKPMTEEDQRKLNALVLDYLHNGCYTSTARIFFKESKSLLERTNKNLRKGMPAHMYMHIPTSNIPVNGDAMDIGDGGGEKNVDVEDVGVDVEDVGVDVDGDFVMLSSPTEEEKHEAELERIDLRKQICTHILNGSTPTAVSLLKAHFPSVITPKPFTPTSAPGTSSTPSSEGQYYDELNQIRSEFGVGAEDKFHPNHLLMKLRIGEWVEKCRTREAVVPYCPPYTYTRPVPVEGEDGDCEEGKATDKGKGKGPSKPSPLSTKTKTKPILPAPGDPVSCPNPTSHPRALPTQPDPNSLIQSAQLLHPLLQSLIPPSSQGPYIQELKDALALLAFIVPEESYMSGWMGGERWGVLGGEVGGAILWREGKSVESNIEGLVKHITVLSHELHSTTPNPDSNANSKPFYVSGYPAGSSSSGPGPAPAPAPPSAPPTVPAQADHPTSDVFFRALASRRRGTAPGTAPGLDVGRVVSRMSPFNFGAPSAPAPSRRREVEVSINSDGEIEEAEDDDDDERDERDERDEGRERDGEREREERERDGGREREERRGAPEGFGNGNVVPPAFLPFDFHRYVTGTEGGTSTSVFADVGVNGSNGGR
ncbi:hypothetical protein SISSUDRAFT_1129182 [Sistotremastrum suecicum HHB10207 ss-3]|uniref:Uncharacterized protein n=1 Tax=Sistotremastrum suecicum HHB10207 ss-3 TaxID=1314776 RepID=A0A166CZQ5_9AGAM|nr:hypothetical protein SISSUDRAFT_1129182 [Sistotremastrum suecicum HHB10207 ss-3]